MGTSFSLLPVLSLRMPWCLHATRQYLCSPNVSHRCPTFFTFEAQTIVIFCADMHGNALLGLAPVPVQAHHRDIFSKMSKEYDTLEARDEIDLTAD